MKLLKSNLQRIKARLTQLVLVVLIAICPTFNSLSACTTAVISGRITADGRPILWKNRDFASAPRNEVAIFTSGKYRTIAVVNAGNRTSIWMGQNEAGLCIENSLSSDLANGKNNKGPGNGVFMKHVLLECETIGDIVEHLKKTNKTGRRTIGNFGVIDAKGGAAMFEIGPKSFNVFDANDPKVAPNGYIARSNFSTTANELEPNPPAVACEAIPSSDRYIRACDLLTKIKEPISIGYVLQNMARDLSAKRKALPGSINSISGKLPETISTSGTISRQTSVSAAVFHGIKPDEDPRITTMWVILGDPKFSVAVPCWANMTQVADPVEGKHGGEIGEVARILRDANLTQKPGLIRSSSLPDIWKDIWPLERKIIKESIKLRNTWFEKGFNAAAATNWHREKADLVYLAMQKELLEAKVAALNRSLATYPSVSRKGLIRVAVYNHSNGKASGPKNLAVILSEENGFQFDRISPEQIRSGKLNEFDVLIMPGGSGSYQSKMLQKKGRSAVQQFVKRGGGYVGICAGSYLASSHYTWSLDLINAQVWDRAHWARGTGIVKLEFTPSGSSALKLPGNISALNRKNKTESVYYGQGPLLVPGNDSHLPRYEVLAEYDSEIVAKGAIPGSMKDTHAIIRSKFGEGRVICYSPHPEKPGGPNELILAGVRWAAKPVTQNQTDK